MEQVYRFDFNGTSNDFKRTPQGFLRVNARLTKTGIFSYEDRREYRSDDEVFRVDSLASLKGAPVTDLHPSEKGPDAFLTPANAKSYMVGITESVERDGPYLKGSLLIFHEDTIKAIEKGELKEVSLGYQCQLEPTAGAINGEAYDAIQRNIIINHVALGPQGWGRAGPDCGIRNDSKKTTFEGKAMSEIVRLDGVDVALTPDNIMTLFAEQKKELLEMSGRLDAVGQELEKERQAKAALEDPKLIEAKLQARLSLIEKCRVHLGDEFNADSKNEEELKLLVIKKYDPDRDLSEKDQAYVNGMFEGICSLHAIRNDSLTNTRRAIHGHTQAKLSNQAYESWVQQSAKLWQAPLSGHRGI